MNTDFTIQHYEHNPRQITKNQFARLKETMREFGDLSGIVINLRLGDDGKEIGELVGGNQRSEAGAFIHSKPTIEKEYDPPLEDGTVAEGYFDYDGRKFNARFVKWDADKVLRANLIANIAGGDWDWDVLANVPSNVLMESGFNDEFSANLSKNNSAMWMFLKSENPPDFKEYDESIAEGIEVCKCSNCGHEHAKKD